MESMKDKAIVELNHILRFGDTIYVIRVNHGSRSSKRHLVFLRGESLGYVNDITREIALATDCWRDNRSGGIVTQDNGVEIVGLLSERLFSDMKALKTYVL